MVFLTSRFVQLFLVLFALGTFDGAPWLGGKTCPRSGVSAAPTGTASARVGIVLKDDGGDGDSTASSSLAPSRRGSVFEDYDLASGNKDAFSAPLHKIDARDDGGVHPLMLFQQHMNRANVKLAQMRSRAPPTAGELAQAILNRRRSIEDAFGGRDRFVDLEARESRRASFKASTSRLPSSHGRIGVVLAGDDIEEVTDEGDGAAESTLDRRLWPGIFDSAAKSTASTNTAKTSSDSASSSTSTAQSIESAKASASSYAYTDTLSPAAPVSAANSLGLAIEANNIGYVATIQMGSNKKPFKMLIDSGSADTWVPSGKCSSCGSNQERLSTSTSSTLKTTKKSWSITYGTGNAKGVLASDDVYVAGLTLKDFTFALATSESDDFNSSPFDGLMGLAQQKLANSKSPTPIDAMFNAKLVKAPVMGYKLGDATASSSQGQQDGEVTFGGVDSSKYTGALVEIPNVSSQGFYEIPIQGVSVNGKTIKTLSTGRTSILDTGTSLMVAPQADAEAVHAKIPGSKSDGQGGFTIPCNTNATVSFKFGGEDWPLLARDMIFVPLDNSNPNGDCVSALGGGTVGQANEWLVGAAALKRLYFATNAEKNVIGLGKLSKTIK